jgi:hypothetical protein
VSNRQPYLFALLTKRMIERASNPSPRASRLCPSHNLNLMAWYVTSQVTPPKQKDWPNKRPETVAKYSPSNDRPDPARAMNTYRRNGDPGFACGFSPLWSYFKTSDTLEMMQALTNDLIAKVIALGTRILSLTPRRANGAG